MSRNAVECLPRLVVVMFTMLLACWNAEACDDVKDGVIPVFLEHIRVEIPRLYDQDAVRTELEGGMEDDVNERLKHVAIVRCIPSKPHLEFIHLKAISAAQRGAHVSGSVQLMDGGYPVKGGFSMDVDASCQYCLDADNMATQRWVGMELVEKAIFDPQAGIYDVLEITGKAQCIMPRNDPSRQCRRISVPVRWKKQSFERSVYLHFELRQWATDAAHDRQGRPLSRNVYLTLASDVTEGEKAPVCKSTWRCTTLEFDVLKDTWSANAAQPSSSASPDLLDKFEQSDGIVLGLAPTLVLPDTWRTARNAYAPAERLR